MNIYLHQGRLKFSGVRYSDVNVSYMIINCWLYVHYKFALINYQTYRDVLLVDMTIFIQDIRTKLNGLLGAKNRLSLGKTRVANHVTRIYPILSRNICGIPFSSEGIYLPKVSTVSII